MRNGKAELVLYPQTTTPPVIVTVLRADVTANPADDLRTLMTVGEVIPARVAATGPQWALALNDVDDDEPIVTAPSLLPAGRRGSAKSRSTPRSKSRRPSPVLAADAAAGPTPVASKSRLPTHPPAAVTPRPNPAMLDRSRPGPKPAPASTPACRSPAGRIDQDPAAQGRRPDRGDRRTQARGRQPSDPTSRGDRRA